MFNLHSPQILKDALGLNPQHYQSFCQYVTERLQALDNIADITPSLAKYFSDWVEDMSVDIKARIMQECQLAKDSVRFGLDIVYDVEDMIWKLLEINAEYIQEQVHNVKIYPEGTCSQILPSYFRNKIINILESKPAYPAKHQAHIDIMIDVYTLQYRGFSQTSIELFNNIYSKRFFGLRPTYNLLDILSDVLADVIDTDNIETNNAFVLLFARELLCYFADLANLFLIDTQDIYTTLVQKYFDYCISQNELACAEEILDMYIENDIIRSPKNIEILIDAYDASGNEFLQEDIRHKFKMQDYGDFGSSWANEILVDETDKQSIKAFYYNS
jgi:hypothetical protein